MAKLKYVQESSLPEYRYKNCDVKNVFVLLLVI